MSRRRFTVSLFVREHASNARGYRYRFNPYLEIGRFELCVDRNGACIHTPRSSFGYIRGAGFWRSGK